MKEYFWENNCVKRIKKNDMMRRKLAIVNLMTYGINQHKSWYLIKHLSYFETGLVKNIQFWVLHMLLKWF